MSPLSFVQMIFSDKHGWPELIKSRPSIVRILLLVVLPLALLPPILLDYAGSNYGDQFIPGFTEKPWRLLAVGFFLAEIVTYSWMGWFIKEVAKINNLEMDFHDAYLLSALVPIPMWLSSLSLLVPNLIFCGVVALAGLMLSCALIYQGVRALAGSQEDVAAGAIMQTVIGAGLVSWAMLLAVTHWA